MTSKLRRVRLGLLCAWVLLALLGHLYATAPAFALPSGGQVGGGAATIHQPNAQSLGIDQMSDRALLHWQGFSIGQGETVQFVQPSATSLAVNRVLGGDPSLIFGQLLANGRVFLLNPNGVLFGPHATVNVGGLMATTLNLKSYDLTTGRFELAQDPTKAFASVINQGTLRVADHGFLVLAAPGVVNDGLIVAKFGQVGLHAGTQLAVDFRGDGLIQYAVEGKVLDQVTDPAGKPLAAAVSNTGRIEADGGTVLLTAKASSAVVSSVINHSGVIQARRLEQQSGEIVLRGGDEGAVMVAGTLDARSEDRGATYDVRGSTLETGGRIDIRGEKVGLTETARLDASGDTGGGTITVGGGFQGKDGGPNAQQTIVRPGATLLANADTNGDGGTVIVWADGRTQFGGTISARGGSQGGNGGFSEVSGKDGLVFRGTVDLLAPLGQSGTLLLDPQFGVVGNNGAGAIGGDILFGDPPNPGTTTIGADSLSALLGSQTVVLQATTDWTFANNVNAVTGNHALTVQAGRSIIFNTNAQVTLTNAGFTATINDAGATINRDAGTAQFMMNNGSSLNTAGGSVTVDVGTFGGSQIGNIVIGNGTGGATVSTGTGSITMTGIGTSPGILIQTGSQILTTGGTITLSGTGGAAAIGIQTAGANNHIGGPATTGDITLRATNTSKTGDGIALTGVAIQSTGQLRLEPLDAADSIGLAGGAGLFNLSATELNSIQNGFNHIFIGRADGTGAMTLGASGYTFQDSVTLQSNLAGGAGTIAVNGPLSTGTAGNSITLLAGRSVTVSHNDSTTFGAVTSTNGPITIIANPSGTSTGTFTGITLNGGTIGSGTGAILLDGTGGNSGSQNIGVALRTNGNSAAIVQSTSGAITINGDGGPAPATSNNHGISMEGSSTQVTSNTGTIEFNGNGGGTTTNNVGISMTGGAKVMKTGTGLLDLEGHGGVGTNGNIGVLLNGSQVSADTATILLTGSGAGTGSGNRGIRMIGNALVTKSGAGSMTITGTGGDGGTSDNTGVQLSNSTISTMTGSTTITGVGGASVAGSNGTNGGINVDLLAVISSTSGAISLNGTGGGGSGTAGDNSGVLVSNLSQVKSTSGAISILGTGGTAPGPENVGVIVSGLSEVLSATGAIAIQGTGGAAATTSSHRGILLANGKVTSSSDGAGTVMLTGTGGAGVNDNSGIVLDVGTVTTKSGNTTLTGLGAGSGANNIGIVISNGSSVASTGPATLTLNGTGLSPGIQISGGANTIGGPAAAGNIELRATNVSKTGDSIVLAGLTLQGTGTLTLAPLDAADSIGLAGGAGLFNLSTTELNFIQNGFSQIVIGRTDGSGHAEVGSYAFQDPVAIISGPFVPGGWVSVIGALSTTGAGDSIQLAAGTKVDLTPGSSVTTNNGPITIVGNPAGVGQAASFVAVDINAATVSAGTGAITITGFGGDVGTDNVGIKIHSGGQVLSSGPGAGAIMLDGYGGPFVGTTATDWNMGVLITGPGSTVRSETGPILIEGDAKGLGKENVGVYLRDSGTIESTGSATITLIGHGASGGTSSNVGVFLNGAGSDVTSVDGNIHIAGFGGNGSGNANQGVFMMSQAQVVSTGSATIEMEGTGGAGAGGNQGVVLVGTDTRVASSAGAVAITGTGGTGTGSNDRGIELLGGAQVVSTGAATISLTGTGGSSTDNNHGVALGQVGTAVTSAGGLITITGTGGGSGGGLSNHGIVISTGAAIDGTNGAGVTLIGTGGQGNATNTFNGEAGVYIIGLNGTHVRTVDGDLSITGNGGGTSFGGYGVFIRFGAPVEATGTGNVLMDGAGSPTGNSFNHGIALFESGTLVRAAVGSVTIGLPVGPSAGAQGGGTLNNNYGVLVANGAVVQAAGGVGSDIVITGTGGGNPGGTSNFGVTLLAGTTQILTNGGNITITGVASNGASPGVFQSGAPVINAGGGTVTINSGP